MFKVTLDYKMNSTTETQSRTQSNLQAVEPAPNTINVANPQNQGGDGGGNENQGRSRGRFPLLHPTFLETLFNPTLGGSNRVIVDYASKQIFNH